MTDPTDRPAWPSGWHAETWHRAARPQAGPWDLVVIGGGITGAGIFSAAAHMGLRVLLLEQADFASGTSSRSSKLVHGGLRYLKQGRLHLTWQSVRERQRLLRRAPDLVEPLPFLYTLYERDRTPPWVLAAGLFLYTHLAAGAGGYERLSAEELRHLTPRPDPAGLRAAFRYRDAWTDDARLVLRVLADGLRAGRGRAAALSSTRVTGLVRAAGRVRAVVARNRESGQEAEIPGRVVINAGGVWADRLRAHLSAAPRLRPLRGSHLFFPLHRLPLTEAVAFPHPADRRPVFAYPWEGVALVGTTDVDHRAPLDTEPTISGEEADYLLEAVRAVFPGQGLGRGDVISTQAGVRPVLDTGEAEPSAESRESLLLSEQGLLTVTGGKLTTFRAVALKALRAAHDLDPSLPRPPRETPVVATAPRTAGPPEPDRPIPGTPYRWGDLLRALHGEGVLHLSDLLLRRLRCGILLGSAAADLVPRLREPVTAALGWDAATWEREAESFRSELRTAHGLPPEWEPPGS